MLGDSCFILNPLPIARTWLLHILQAKQVAEQAGKVRIDANLMLEHDTEEEEEKGKLYLVVVDQAEVDEEQLTQRMVAEVKPLLEDTRPEAQKALLQFGQKKALQQEGENEEGVTPPPKIQNGSASAAASPPGGDANLTPEPPPARRQRKGGGKGSTTPPSKANILDPRKIKGNMEPDTQTSLLMIISALVFTLFYTCVFFVAFVFHSQIASFVRIRFFAKSKMLIRYSRFQM